MPKLQSIVQQLFPEPADGPKPESVPPGVLAIDVWDEQLSTTGSGSLSLPSEPLGELPQNVKRVEIRDVPLDKFSAVGTWVRELCAPVTI